MTGMTRKQELEAPVQQRWAWAYEDIEMNLDEPWPAFQKLITTTGQHYHLSADGDNGIKELRRLMNDLWRLVREENSGAYLLK